MSEPQPQVLLVEDEADIAIIFQEALRAAGFAPTHIANGRLALEYLKTHTPPLVVLDLHLPGMDGSGVLAEIRADPNLDKTLVVLATADSVMAESLDPQADFILLKPISFSQLRDLAIRWKTMLASR